MQFSIYLVHNLTACHNVSLKTQTVACAMDHGKQFPQNMRFHAFHQLFVLFLRKSFFFCRFFFIFPLFYPPIFVVGMIFVPFMIKCVSVVLDILMNLIIFFRYSSEYIIDILPITPLTSLFFLFTAHHCL